MSLRGTVLGTSTKEGAVLLLAFLGAVVDPFFVVAAFLVAVAPVLVLVGGAFSFPEALCCLAEEPVPRAIKLNVLSV